MLYQKKFFQKGGFMAINLDKEALEQRIQSIKSFFSICKNLVEEDIQEIILYSQKFVKPFYIYTPQQVQLCSFCGTCGYMGLKKGDLIGIEICKVNQQELIQIKTEYLAICLDMLGYIKSFERTRSSYILKRLSGTKSYLHNDFIYFPPSKCPISHSFKYVTTKLKKEEKSWLK